MACWSSPIFRYLFACHLFGYTRIYFLRFSGQTQQPQDLFLHGYTLFGMRGLGGLWGAGFGNVLVAFVWLDWEDGNQLVAWNRRFLDLEGYKRDRRRRASGCVWGGLLCVCVCVCGKLFSCIYWGLFYFGIVCRHSTTLIFHTLKFIRINNTVIQDAHITTPTTTPPPPLGGDHPHKPPPPK